MANAISDLPANDRRLRTVPRRVVHVYGAPIGYIYLVCAISLDGVPAVLPQQVAYGSVRPMRIRAQRG
ncbi:MAG TPA: hypothetical protein VND80_09740 [Steroidobacteraceae bacterium]|nr:hypothetical protein [Steroidobacteraceae bacterium]